MEEKIAVGVDVGGTKILSAVVTENGTILSRAKRKTKSGKTQEEILARIAACCREAMDLAHIPIEKIAGVGVGSPGPLDPVKGIIIETPNVNLTGAPIIPYLKKELRLPAYLDNDVNVGTLGEFVFGVGKGKKNVVGMFIGTGLGGGIIIDGKLLHGFSYNAGELGHMKIRVGGAKCGCGQKGCLEAYASKTAIIRRLKKAVQKGAKTNLMQWIDGNWANLTGKIFKKAVDAKDSLVVSELNRAAKYTGVAVGSLLNILSPEMVIIGGGMLEAYGEKRLDLIREFAKKNCFPIAFEGVKIVPAKLGDDAGILGAAALVFQHLNATVSEI